MKHKFYLHYSFSCRSEFLNKRKITEISILYTVLLYGMQPREKSSMNMVKNGYNMEVRCLPKFLNVF